MLHTGAVALGLFTCVARKYEENVARFRKTQKTHIQAIWNPFKSAKYLKQIFSFFQDPILLLLYSVAKCHKQLW